MLPHCIIILDIFQNNNKVLSGFPLTSGQILQTLFLIGKLGPSFGEDKITHLVSTRGSASCDYHFYLPDVWEEQTWRSEDCKHTCMGDNGSISSLL